MCTETYDVVTSHITCLGTFSKGTAPKCICFHSDNTRTRVTATLWLRPLTCSRNVLVYRTHGKYTKQNNRNERKSKRMRRSASAWILVFVDGSFAYDEYDSIHSTHWNPFTMHEPCECVRFTYTRSRYVVTLCSVNGVNGKRIVDE